MSHVDIPSIYTAFPEDIKPPKRLIQFLEWLSNTIYIDLLAPDLAGEKLDDFWIINGGYLSNKFGLFLHQADGSRVGFWFYDDNNVQQAPIVILGSESGQDDVKIIANSIEDFVARILEGKTGIHELSFELNDEDGDEKILERWLSDLEEWLEETWNITPEARSQFVNRDPTCDHPDFQEWLDKWSDEQVAIQRRNSTLQEIVNLLIKYLPDTEEYIASLSLDPESEAIMRAGLTPEGYFSWQSANFHVFIVGSKFEIWRQFYQKYPVENGSQLETLFRRIRFERAQNFSEQGLWFSAWVNVYPSGDIQICRKDQYGPPDFQQSKPTIFDYREDFSSFPRAAEFIPPWLKAMLEPAGWVDEGNPTTP